jgi:hypothetical protein
MTGWRFGDRSLAFAACAMLGLAALLPVSAAASTSGSVSSGPKLLSAHQSVQPGDWIAFGYELSVGGQHAAATFHVQNGVAKFPYSCQQSWSSTSTSISVTFPAGAISIPANDNHWYPNAKPDAAASYELSMQAPNLCGGNPMWLGADDQHGVLYTATLSSTDTTDQVQVQFHGVDANSLANNGNIDCSNPQSNPNGGGMCNGAWSPHVTTTAAQYSTPPPPQSSPPSQSPSSAPPSSAPSSAPPSSAPSSSPPSASSSPSGGGTGSSAPPSSGGTSTSGSGSTTSGTGTSGSSTGSSGATGGSHGGVSAPGGMVVVKGITSRSGVLGVTTHVPAGTPAAGHAASSGQQSAPASTPAAPLSAAQAIANTALGPVPVVIPGIAAAIGRAGAALPWNWFLALALVDGLLMALIVVRRRRAAQPA